MKPTARQLHGWSLEDAECMGKPNFGARYLSDDPMNMTRYTRDIGHHCAICGRESTNTHHQPYRQTFEMVTPNGIWRLRPALFALCGSGTFGCHGKVEANEIRISWKWFTEEAETKWWNGELLAEYGPHSVKLYRFGCWAIEMPDGSTIERRKTYRRDEHGELTRP